MEESTIDWTRTRAKLCKLIALFICQKCGNTLQEPCSFQMCGHYFCKSCAMNLINCGTNCPGCDAVLWREHLQPNLRISEAMKICQQISNLIKDEDNFNSIIVRNAEEDEPDDLIAMEVEEDTEVIGNEEYDVDESDQNISCVEPHDSGDPDSSKICRGRADDVDDDLSYIKGDSVHSVYMLSLGKALGSKHEQEVREYAETTVDFNVDDEDIDSQSGKQQNVLTAIKSIEMVDNFSGKTHSMERSTPSPEKSQFSDAVSDEQFAQGVQRNPKCLTRKSKFTYSRKRKGKGMAVNVEGRKEPPMLVTSRSFSPVKDQSIFEFSSGTITKPISFDKSEIVNKANCGHSLVDTVSVDSVSVDSPIFDFISGTVTKSASINSHVSKEEKKLSAKNSKREREVCSKLKDISDKKEAQKLSTDRENIIGVDDKVQKMKVRNLEKRNKKGETSLHTACIKGNYERAKELLELGAQPNTKDFNGWTPLHEASNHGFTNVVALLLDHNAIIDCVAGEDNDTPLHDAVSNNRFEVAKLLIQRGAPTKIKNRVGLYPEGYAYTNEMQAVFKEMSMLENHEVSNNQLDISSTLCDSYVFVSTNLKASEIVEVKKCCDRFDGKLLTEFDTSVTHVICGSDENGISLSRTMKYLLAVLTGKWLVSFAWISESLKKNKWVLEATYEVKGLPGASEEIPLKSRLNNFKCLPKLFDGCSFYLSGVYNKNLSKENLTNLIQLGGGKMLYREPKPNNVDPLIVSLPRKMGKLDVGLKATHPDIIFHAKENSAQVCCKEYIIYDAQENPFHKKIFSPVLCTAPVAWLLDCISNFQILDIEDVYVCELYTSSQN